eukprot:g5890.t1
MKRHALKFSKELPSLNEFKSRHPDLPLRLLFKTYCLYRQLLHLGQWDDVSVKLFLGEETQAEVVVQGKHKVTGRLELFEPVDGFEDTIELRSRASGYKLGIVDTDGLVVIVDVGESLRDIKVDGG